MPSNKKNQKQKRNKKVLKFSKLNVFANSPKTVKVFGSLVTLLMVVSVGYGGYTLISERFSSASSTSGLWRVGSPNLHHRVGGKWSYGNRTVWRVDSNPKNGWRYAWISTGKHLDPGHLYLACFYYYFADTLYHNVAAGGRAKIGVKNHLNSSGGSNRTIVEGEITGIDPKERNTFTRKCLPFRIPSKWKHNRVGTYVFVTYPPGYNEIYNPAHGLYIRASKISLIRKENNELNNLRLFKPDGYQPVVTSKGY